MKRHPKQKVFYLDIQDEVLKAQLEKNIIKVGGKVSQTLTQEVRFYIKDKNNRNISVSTPTKTELENPLNNNNNSNVSNQNQSSRDIPKSFIYILDTGYICKPFYQEYEKLPDIQQFLSKNSKPRDQNWTTQSLKNNTKKIRKKKKKIKGNGFCENCNSRFKNYDNHLINENHRNFARNQQNFTKIDELFERINSSKNQIQIQIQNQNQNQNESFLKKRQKRKDAFSLEKNFPKYPIIQNTEQNTEQKVDLVQNNGKRKVEIKGKESPNRK
ncbi:protein dbf4 [Anaeramoeba ignava]|uniref:Protein dbf4 n=1 Tax=Anaeramoeba ignava TaxID=1746090 RepID=A0A9Q0LFU2_ANAIG|nr:protein dbf4 [Anaeramoeba ignava]